MSIMAWKGNFYYSVFSYLLPASRVVFIWILPDEDTPTNHFHAFEINTTHFLLYPFRKAIGDWWQLLLCSDRKTDLKEKNFLGMHTDKVLSVGQIQYIDTNLKIWDRIRSQITYENKTIVNNLFVNLIL